MTVGTLFERSKIPLHKWFVAVYLLCSSKEGISSHQIHRMLGVTYKTAWFMSHRIREAMREGKFPGGLGGANKGVEADESFVGGKAKNRAFGPPPKKEAEFALVEREGKVRSFHVPAVNAKTLRPILVTQIDRKSDLMTDEAGAYVRVCRELAALVVELMVLLRRIDNQGVEVERHVALHPEELVNSAGICREFCPHRYKPRQPEVHVSPS